MCVNPNFSKRIIGRLSDRIFRDLISAVVGAVDMKTRSKTAMRIFPKILILDSPVVGNGGGRRWSKKRRVTRNDVGRLLRLKYRE